MSDAPPKFIVENGCKKLSPAYKAWKAAQNSGAAAGAATSSPPSVINADTALPVACTTQQLQELAGTGGGASAESSAAVATCMTQVGDDMARLQQIFAINELPLNLLPRLFVLTEFEEILVLVDDSGSMRKGADPRMGRDPATNEPWSRWHEASARLVEMLEIVAYLPSTPAVHISFLNHTAKHDIPKKGEGEDGASYFDRARGAVLQAFDFRPAYGTPAEKCIAEMLQRANRSGNTNKQVLCVCFFDGRPDGPTAPIAEMIAERPHPKSTPFSFLTVTDTPADVEWIQEIDEAAQNVSEVSNFAAASELTIQAQGVAFPFTRGLYVLQELLGGIDSLFDNLDEGVPLTKLEIGEICGYMLSQEDYMFYFSSFVSAQLKARGDGKRDGKISEVDRIRHRYAEIWDPSAFAAAASTKDIDAVAAYRRELSSAAPGMKRQNRAKQKQKNMAVAPMAVVPMVQEPMMSQRQQPVPKKEDSCPCLVQ